MALNRSQADIAASSSAAAGGDGRDRFSAAELAIVLSQYDLGAIESIKEFPRGSRRAPKMHIRAQRGSYLLKRRAAGKDDPFKVALSHQMQLYLASKQFPLPLLIGTRDDNNSMLQYNGEIYELFEFIQGVSYESSLEITGEAGKTLALFHKLLRDFESEYRPHTGTYHRAKSVTTSLRIIPRTLAQGDPEGKKVPDEIIRLMQYLYSSYKEAAARAEDLGLDQWPTQIIHCDWHPGNMLFRGNWVVAVLDYDVARIHQRVIDIANGALQFSILGGAQDPTQWPDAIDMKRFIQFLHDYESVPDCMLSKAALKSLAWLMIEALIAEAAIPIANTGTFARIKGEGFLRMVERKVGWLHDHASQLAVVLDK